MVNRETGPSKHTVPEEGSPCRSSVSVPATCGELAQGVLCGTPCLVSCPIDLYSTAQVATLAPPFFSVPAGRIKAAVALRAGLEYLGRPDVGTSLSLLSKVPIGRGYGSSTADVAATLYALGDALDRPLEATEVGSLAVSVEPSDSSLFPDLTVFDHRHGSFHLTLGPAPNLAVVVLDPGGEVDSVLYNRIDRSAAQKRLEPDYAEMFGLLRQGVTNSDVEAMGAAATLSAVLHQDLLHNPLLDAAIALGKAVGAVGVCRAHSGTILGLLFDPATTDLATAITCVRRGVPGSVSVTAYSLVGGGPRVRSIDRKEGRIGP